MEFIAGRDNLACTIFVPFDCANNCPFCTSKDMYKEGGRKKDIDAIIKVIRKVSINPDVTEFVFTGGEPFADLENLKRMVREADKPVFINTSLPLHNGDIDDVIAYINEENRIKGVNISRHMGFTFKGVADRSIIERISKPVRINTVIGKGMDIDYLRIKFPEFVKQWEGDNIVVNLRADYKGIDFDNLKTMDDVERLLSEIYIHRGGGGCLVCNTVHFDTDTCHVQYHRGRMYSSVVMGEKLYVNDIIVTMDGNVYCDWDFKEVEGFSEWLFKPDNMPKTTVEMTLDWTGEKPETYYYATYKNHDVHITKKREEAGVITNDEILARVIKQVRRQIGQYVKTIKPLKL